MVDAHHALLEACTDVVDVVEGQGAVVELVVVYLVVDDVVNHVVDVLFVLHLEALAGRLDGVDHHDHGRFAREGGGAEVAEIGYFDFLARMVQFGLGVEVAGDGGSVVGADEVGHFGRKVVFLGEGDAVANMLGDDAGGVLVVEILVGVEAVVLVFGEIERRHDFADVVVERAHFGQQRVAADFVDDVLADVGHLHAVLEGAGRLLRQFAEGRGVGAGDFQQGEVGGHAKHALEEEDERVGEEGEHRVEKEDEEARGVDVGKAGVGAEDSGDIDDGIGEEDDQGDSEEVAAPFEVTDGDDGHHARNELVEYELVAVGHHVADDDDGHDVDVEGDTHVEEDAHQDGHHADRRQQNQVGISADKEGDDGADEDDDEEGEGDLLEVVEHGVADVFEEDVERHEGDDAEKRLTQVVEHHIVFGRLARLFLTFERGDDLCRLLVNALALGHDALVLLYHARGVADLRQPAVELEMGALAVEDDGRGEDAVGEQRSQVKRCAAVGHILPHQGDDVGGSQDFGGLHFATHIAVEEHDRMSEQRGVDVGIARGMVYETDNLLADEPLVGSHGCFGETAVGVGGRRSVDQKIKGRFVFDLVGGAAGAVVVEGYGEIVWSIEVVAVPERADGVVVLHPLVVVGKHDEN